jgi:hypothetical protein
VIFAKPALMQVGTLVLSDHNRSEVSIDWEIFEKRTRTANATLRKYHVAKKKGFDVSWDDIPGTDTYTVDNYAGAEDMDDYFAANMGSLTLTMRFDHDDVQTYQVMVKSFSLTPKKRGKYTFYDASLSLEEV